MSEQQEEYVVSFEAKRAIIQRKQAMYRSAVYDAQLDVKVARLLGDRSAEQKATEQVKRMLMVLDLLEEELAALVPNEET